MFTILFAAFALHERPRREQLVGGLIAFGGLAVIVADRATSAPLLPFALIVGGAACWGVSNVLTRQAQPPDPLALLVWASAFVPLPMLAVSLAFEGAGEVGDALAGIDARGAGGAGLRRAAQRALRLRRLDGPAQALHRRRDHPVRAARAGVRDRERRAAAG